MKQLIFSFLFLLSFSSFAGNTLGKKLAELAGTPNSAGNIEDLFRFNAPFSIDFKSYDSWGKNPIQAAISNNNCENLKPILDYSNRLLNFDINEKDAIFQYTPLEFAIVNSRQECIFVLINFKETNLNSFVYGTNQNIFQALVSNKNLEGITKIVMQERFDINQSLPSFDGNTNLIWTLSLNGAVDISFENDVTKILINNAADVNAQNNKGQTALMIAAYFGNLEMIIKLNENKADFSKKDLGKRTALDYATLNNHQDIIDYIKAKK